MHEYSIVQALIRRAEETARAHAARRVEGLRVRIGTLAGVEPVLLLAAFEVCREGTLLGDAELSIESVEAQWACRCCGCGIAAGGALRCEACGGPGQLVAGSEIELDSIALEVDDV
ncbi:MAG: hydrogenase maturation nickel metallochaperone HypA [Candidatus Schekmanbacteria bacterium]|nr:hydrogenase maturation nickel metallochaperone HypA [Candidatus Schekmanbacteria bacterium]